MVVVLIVLRSGATEPTTPIGAAGTLPRSAAVESAALVASTAASTSSTDPPVITAPTATSPTTGAPAPSTTVAVPPTAPPDAAAMAARPIPDATPVTPPAPDLPRPPWADSTRRSAAGYLTTDIGCAGGTDAGSLDEFFSRRMGPVIGADYQHVYPLGGDRYLWLLQDTFVDHSGGATKLTQAGFVHNAALVQQGRCFTLYHGGTTKAPTSFDLGAGEAARSRWFWPMGGELSGDRLSVFWAEMHKDNGDPSPGDGLGWHPARTWLATYDRGSLARLSFDPATNDDVRPIYGYAVASDDEFSYLFGNTFEQNLAREGGFWNGPHSGSAMWLARVPRGRLGDSPEYRTLDGWSPDAAAAQPIVRRYWAENPMQPRLLGGIWTAATKVDGYWGEELAIDVAEHPWGPWVTLERRGLDPHAAGRRIINTYHAHLMPWLAGGRLVVSVSQNARDMVADAYPHPERYRPMFVGASFSAPPPPPPETTVPTTSTLDPSTTVAPTTTIAPTTSGSTTTISGSTTVATTTTIPPTSTSPTTSTTSTPTSTTPTSATSTSTTTTTTLAATTTTPTTSTIPPTTTAAPP